MKRIFSLLFVALACSAAALAQNDLVATLKHGSTISEYYGISALADAYEAAATGDVITLSSGMFDAVDIEKDITVRGAGMQLANPNPTLLNKSFTITIPANSTALTLEGVQCMSSVTVIGAENMETASILKCYFQSDVYCCNSNPTFMHCVFASFLHSFITFRNDALSFNTYVNCLECAINYPDAEGQKGWYLAKMDLVNCVVNYPRGMEYSTFNNCIIRGWSESYFNSNHYITNSLCINTSGITPATNTFINADYSTVFKTFTGSFYTTETFELTDEAKAQYLGDDGTQVGIYGGANPFDPTPSNPQVKKFAVTTNTVNGKLNVNINVE